MKSLWAEEYYPTAIVEDTRAIFSIPIFHQNSYKWYEDSHKDNDVEYECLIHLHDFRFGFTLYNMPFMKEKSGNISKLLKHGQVDIWKITETGGTRVENNSVSINYTSPIPFLIIEINDTETIKMLFSYKPKEIGFTVYGFDAPFTREYLTIEYK